MNLFEIVKASVHVPETARMYGLTPDRHGMVRCPFHEDRHPSLKLNEDYFYAGKSGRSIEGRVQFNQMIEDIKSDKDGVSYVLVFKLSRFEGNAADVLSSLQTMQDFGVNLICVEDGIF